VHDQGQQRISGMFRRLDAAQLFARIAATFPPPANQVNGFERSCTLCVPPVPGCRALRGWLKCYHSYPSIGVLVNIRR
jgi:hypothetical protein